MRITAAEARVLAKVDLEEEHLDDLMAGIEMAAKAGHRRVEFHVTDEIGPESLAAWRRAVNRLSLQYGYTKGSSDVGSWTGGPSEYREVVIW